MASYTDIADSWEEIDESELVARPFSLQDVKVQMTIPNGQPLGSIHEDSVRTQYSPPEPSVKILKRPSKGEDGCSVAETLVNGDVRHGKTNRNKTLQQRQLDYAEARLRILGEAKSPEDELDEKLNQMNFVGSSSSGNNNIKNSSSNVPVTLLRPSDAANVVRLPRGPDGTKGFSIKR